MSRHRRARARAAWALAALAGCHGSPERAVTPKATVTATVDAAPDDARDAGDASAGDATTTISRRSGGASLDEIPLVIGVGQSLCAGVGGHPILSTEQPYGNLTLWDPGPEPKFSLDGGAELTFVPLVEPIRQGFPDDAGYPRFGYPNHIKGETFHTAMANTISALTAAEPGGHVVRTVHVNACEGARSLADIRRGGKSRAYAAMLFEARAYTRLVKAEGRVPRVTAVVLTHGEADAENPAYEATLATYFDEVRDDLRAITGQKDGPMFFATPQSAVPGRGKDRPLRSLSTFETCRLAHSRDDVVCVAPKYDFPYAKDRIHLTAVGYRRLGEKLGEAYVATVVRHQKFRPLEALSADLEGTTVRVRFHVPVPPLGWDATLGPGWVSHTKKAHPWAKGHGFEAEDAEGAITITRAAIEGDAVVLALARRPGRDAFVRYAMTQNPDGEKGYRGGEPDGRTGELVDSAATEGLDMSSVDATATRGSAVLTGAFEGHGRRDVVRGEGITKGAVVVAHSANEITLSSPFTSASGAVHVRLGADPRNHALAFELAISR